MNSKTALERCIFWQQQVIARSRNPAQIARCQAAIKRLQAQLSAA